MLVGSAWASAESPQPEETTSDSLAPLEQGPPPPDSNVAIETAKIEPENALEPDPVENSFSGSNCGGGQACFWKQGSFNGFKKTHSIAGQWRYVTGFENWFQSYKNRFNNRKVEVGTQYNVIKCLSPGGNAKNPGIFDRYRAGQVGSRC